MTTTSNRGRRRRKRRRLSLSSPSSNCCSCCCCCCCCCDHQLELQWMQSASLHHDEDAHTAIRTVMRSWCSSSFQKMDKDRKKIRSRSDVKNRQDDGWSMNHARSKRQTTHGSTSLSRPPTNQPTFIKLLLCATHKDKG